MNPQELRRRVQRARVARLATVRPDGTPHLVPVCFAVDGDEIVSAVDAKPKTTTRLARLDNIGAHPSVALIVDHYDDDDWSALWWVRVDGHADVLADGADSERALTLLVDKYAQYRERTPPGPVILMRAERWTGWSARSD